MNRRITFVLAGILLLATAAPASVAAAGAGNITPCLHGASKVGVFSALYQPYLDASGTAPNGWLSEFARQHTDPADCE